MRRLSITSWTFYSLVLLGFFALVPLHLLQSWWWTGLPIEALSDWLICEARLDVALPLRVTLAFPLLAVVLAARPLIKHLLRTYRRISWWDIGDKQRGGLITWEDVLTLASLEKEDDPANKAEEISNQDKVLRPMSVLQLAYWGAMSLSSGLACGLALDLLLFPKVPNLIYWVSEEKQTAGALAAASGNLTAYLALIAAVTSIFFTFRQLRSKVRSEARQKWLQKTRKLMARVIAQLIKLKAYQHTFDRQLHEDRLHLELMLNPSEKDHKLLGLLIRAYLGVKIEGDQFVWAEIEKELKRRPQPESICKLCAIVERREVLPGERTDAISFIVKLSHVVLKREWEQVRHIR